MAVYAKIVIQFLKSFVSKPKINGFFKIFQDATAFWVGKKIKWVDAFEDVIMPKTHIALFCHFCSGRKMHYSWSIKCTVFGPQNSSQSKLVNV